MCSSTSVPHRDIDEAVRLSRPLPGDTDTRRLPEDTVAALVRGMREIRGTFDLPVPPGASRCLPVPPGATGPSARFFPLHVFVAALPYVRAHHREPNIPTRSPDARSPMSAGASPGTGIRAVGAADSR
ncbi:acyltransferase domain-containing protein [Streptomyces sp. NPDC005859]|uniref:acyltransferase domain-containing protein n=1 Tax=Streptomyces sp. NPDC005859 TaxID=3157170 RepID=UPI0033C9A8B4